MDSVTSSLSFMACCCKGSNNTLLFRHILHKQSVISFSVAKEIKNGQRLRRVPTKMSMFNSECLPCNAFTVQVATLLPDEMINLPLLLLFSSISTRLLCKVSYFLMYSLLDRFTSFLLFLPLVDGFQMTIFVYPWFHNTGSSLHKPC